MASLLTGAYPRTTGLRLRPRVMPESLTVLPEVFADAGYRTGAVVANFNVGRTLGFQQGFEFFRESWKEGWRAEQGERRFRNAPGRVKEYTNATLVNDQALGWLRRVPRDERVFLWLHYMDPHGPYDPPERYGTLFLSEHPPEPLPPGTTLPAYQVQTGPTGQPISDLAWYRAQYDREVRYLDDEIGRLLDELRALGRENLLIVLTADHGESFREHGYYLEHGKLPYQTTAHVPAIVVHEGVVPAGRTIGRPVGVIDLAPTLVELAGLPVPEPFEGTSLVPLIRGDAAAAPPRVYMESGYAAEPQRTVRDGRWKLVEVPDPGDRQAMTGARLELYDLESDPRELANVASAHPEVVERLAADLARWAEARPVGDASAEAVDLEGLDTASRDMLRALGYVEGEESRAAPAAEPGADASTARDASLGPDDALAGVVLLVLDTMRADRLSIAGHERQTTPALDALARRGAWFEQAVTGAPWTLPAMIGLVTGRNPTAELYDEGGLRRSAVETLREAGIRTASFNEGGFVSAHFGFDRGFDEHVEYVTKVRLADTGTIDDVRASRASAHGVAQTFRAAGDWLAEHGRDGRFFLLVHTYEPHTPYTTRLYARSLRSGRIGRTLDQNDSNHIHAGEWELLPHELAYVEALYDGGVSTTDRHAGRLLGRLRSLGLADRVAVIATADHGEDLGGRDPRHVADHGHSLYDELLRVPLVVHDPRRPAGGRRVASQVRLVDVMPTVLDLLGLPPLPDADGRSLVPLLRDEEDGDRVAFSRVTRKGPDRVSVRRDGFKLIREVGPEGLGRAELYDLAADPGERHDLAAEQPERVAALDVDLRAYVEELRAEGPLDFGLVRDDMPDALREQLRALGYLE
jgi:arylsulfatase A-like enzyme